MKNFITMIKLNKVGKVLAISSFLVFASVLAFAPRHSNQTRAEGCAVFSQPIFNPFPVTWATDPGAGCNDFAVLSADVYGTHVWAPSVNANIGDQISLRVYVHNGAYTNGPTMHNVAYNVNLDTSAGSSHTITAQLTASNAAEKDGSITINTPAGASLQLVGGDLRHQIGDLQSCFDFSQAFYITVKVVGPTVQPPTGQNTLTANPGNVCLANNVLPGTLSWTNSSDVKSVHITVEDKTAADGIVNSVTNNSGAVNGSITTNYLRPGHVYEFVMYNTTGGQHTLLQQITEQVPNINCGGTTPPPVKPSVQLTVSNFCVGQTPTYTVHTDASLAGQQLYWSSTFNGNNTGESNANYGQALDGNGNWTSAAARAWTTADIGNWTKTVGVVKNGVATAKEQQFSFNVQNCGGNTPPPALVCFANVASANINDDVTFTATGGNGNYVWATSNSSNAATGSSFVVHFASAGQKTVSVTSNGQTVNCGVTINAPATQTSTGNCNNDSNSCNVNTNNNNQTSSGNNSPNQNNQNNVNGNNNTITNTNNNCLYNSCNNNYSVTDNPPAQVYTQTYQQPVTYTPVNNQQVLGASTNLTYSKRAINETKNADATAVNASREDFITYTLTVTNTGSAPATNFVVTDDLSQVLPYADIVDNGGGYMNGNTISFPANTVPAGGSISDSFKVRVKYALADNISYTMSNTYGNTVTIHINNPQVLGAFTAPKTGADTNAFVFGGLLTAMAAVVIKRKTLLQLIFT